MPTISFHVSQKSRVDEARMRWQRSLPKEPGQIGMAVVVWVEHPPIGEERIVEVNEGFVDFLRQESVPFDAR
jgi:hypothetical protein